MSYDLYFYKRKDNKLTEEEIVDTLSQILPDQKGNDWVFEDEDTQVYFVISREEPDNDKESVESFDSYPDYVYMHFTFNLNFIRPNFFGIQAFKFVTRFANEYDLYVLNPQDDADTPVKCDEHALLENWAKTNLHYSADRFAEFGLSYLPIDKSDYTWRYNDQRKAIQEKLGSRYFVPKIFYAKRRDTGEVITLLVWTDHIPIVLPVVDFIIVVKERRKLFRTIKKTGIVPYHTILETMGSYFEDFDFEGAKIIHPTKAEKVKDIFNSLKLDINPEDFSEGVAIEKIVNARPNPA